MRRAIRWLGTDVPHSEPRIIWIIVIYVLIVRALETAADWARWIF